MWLAPYVYNVRYDLCLKSMTRSKYVRDERKFAACLQIHDTRANDCLIWESPLDKVVNSAAETGKFKNTMRPAILGHCLDQWIWSSARHVWSLWLIYASSGPCFRVPPIPISIATQMFPRKSLVLSHLPSHLRTILSGHGLVWRSSFRSDRIFDHLDSKDKWPRVVQTTG